MTGIKARKSRTPLKAATFNSSARQGKFKVMLDHKPRPIRSTQETCGDRGRVTGLEGKNGREGGGKITHN